MPEPDLEDLRRKIIADLEQVDQVLKHQRREEERHKRPVLRLLKGGLIGGLILAGVEWLRDYKRIGAALIAAGITVTAAVLVEQHPSLPGADPPIGPKTVSPTVPPRPSTTRPTVTPAPSTPPRTSPLRTLGTRAIEPTGMRSSTPRIAPPRTLPPPTPTVLITQTLTPIPVTVTPPTIAIPTIPAIAPTCVAEVSTDLLDLDLCLPLE